ncbi:MAG: hypothetical protein JWO19_4422 [Bryobacterales bacterium]|nr:hypothetical protein [Bryobacterales bacterium]
MAPNLDGKDEVKATPFDAHEQAVRATKPGKLAEFPKAVDHVDHPSGVGKQPVVVNSADEEEAYHEAKAEAEAEAEAEE